MIYYFFLILLTQLIGGLFAYEIELCVGNDKLAVAGWLIVTIIAWFILLWLLKPKARIKDLVYKKLGDDEKLHYRGLITIVAPILIDKYDDGQTKRKAKIDNLKEIESDQALLDEVEKGFGGELRQFATIVNIAKRCRNLKYVWLITTDSKVNDTSKTAVDAKEEAKILGRILRSINKNVTIFMGEEIKLETPKDGIPPHIRLLIQFRNIIPKLLRRDFEQGIVKLHYSDADTWSPDIINTVFRQVDMIYEKHLPLLGLRDKSVLAQPMNGLKQISNGVLFAALPDSRDITLSIRDDKKGSKDVLYRFKSFARLRNS